MGNAKLRGLPAPKPLGRFSKKFLHGWLRRGPHPARKYRGQSVIGSKGACLRMREIVTLRCLFFLSFFHLMRFATGRLVGPIVAVNSSNDASWWPSRPFYGFVNKKIFFYIFTQKCEKLHYTLRELWTAITLASLKIRTSCLHQTGGFRSRPI